MLGYLKKFNNLPADLKRKISDGEVMKKIEALEKKYNVALAALIMKVMVREVALNDLSGYLVKENLTKEAAAELALELKERVFSSLGSYLFAATVKPVKPITTAMPPYAPPENEPKVKGANFFFSSDDEEEIRRLTQKIVMAEDASATSATVDDKLKEIVDRVQINFGSADLAERFSQILRTYLRGIRDMLETKAALMKPFLSGGLSFDENSAEKVMLLAIKVLNSPASRPVKTLPKINLPELNKSNYPSGRDISRDAAYDFSRLAGKNKDLSAPATEGKKLDTSHELAPLTPTLVSGETKRPDAPKIKEKAPIIPKNSQSETGPIIPAPGTDSGVTPLIKRRFEAENLSQSQKIKIEDVKYVPRVMGPLDEIKYMDLINFRRLDRDALRSAEKIKNKINLLEEEAYGKRLEGIKLWRLSPINKLYLAIGHLSISENKPVDVIIEERKMAGSDYLTTEEFKAIMDLNKSLRF